LVRKVCEGVDRHESALSVTAAGHEFELVPLDDPAAAKRRQSLGVRLLFRGRPLAGAQVECGDGVSIMKEDIPRFPTDGEGMAVISGEARADAVSRRPSGHTLGHPGSRRG
jgi:uncharacterized GH25 family protein